MENSKTMQEYINQTPTIVHRYLEDNRSTEIQSVVNYLLGENRLITTGCGTSFHNALFASLFLRKNAAIDTYAIPSFDLNHYSTSAVVEKPVIAYSHSGKTKATLDTIKKLKSYNIKKIISIASDIDTPLSNLSDYRLASPGGFEEATPKTMSFTASGFQMLDISVEVGNRKGLTVQKNLEPNIIKQILGESLVDNREIIINIAKKYRNMDDFLITGGGPAWITALEIALKMRETNYTNTTGFELEEFTHGPIPPSIGPDRVVICIVLDGPSIERAENILFAAAHVGSPTIAIVEDSVKLSVSPNHIINIPKCQTEEIAALVSAIPLQLFSHDLSFSKGIDPNTYHRHIEEYAHASTTWMFPPGTH